MPRPTWQTDPIVEKAMVSWLLSLNRNPRHHRPPTLLVVVLLTIVDSTALCTHVDL